MQENWSYSKNSDDFIEKIKNIGQIPEGAILATADVVGRYLNIPHRTDLEAFKKRLNQRKIPRVPTEELIKMVDFVFKNNFFEFNEEVKRQKLGTEISTKFAPPCAYIFMDAVETEFLASQNLQPYGSVILMTCSLYGLTEKKNSFSFLINLITSTLI